MLIFLVLLLVIGVGCLLGHKDSLDVLGTCMTGLGLIAYAIILIPFISVHIAWDVDYQNTLYEKQMLEYRLDHMDDNIVGNELLYNDIVEFNNGLRQTKWVAENPWINWLANTDIATIDYVEYDAQDSNKEVQYE